MLRTKGWLPVLVVLALLLAACNVNLQATAGPMESRTETVELGDAGSVRVELNMDSGNLTLAGGAADLMDAEFRWNVPAWEPTVSYEGGVLTVAQGTTDERLPSDARSEWDIALNDDVPLELVMDSTAFNADLDLSTLNLASLTLEGAAGNLDLLNLGGEYANLTAVQVNLASGNVTFDLTGSYPALESFSVEVTAGNLTVRVPSGVNVVANAVVTTGTIVAPDFSASDGEYTYEAGGAESTLTLDLSVDAGNITLEVAG